MVVRFHEDLTEPGFANRIVFGIKLVKSVEGIPILKFVKSRGGKKKIRKSEHLAFFRSAKNLFPSQYKYILRKIARAVKYVGLFRKFPFKYYIHMYLSGSSLG